MLKNGGAGQRNLCHQLWSVCSFITLKANVNAQYHGHWQKTQDSWVRDVDFIPCSKTVARESACLHSFSWATNSQRSNMDDLHGCYYMLWPLFKDKNTELWTRYFIVASKQTCSEWDITSSYKEVAWIKSVYSLLFTVALHPCHSQKIVVMEMPLKGISPSSL